MRFIVCFIRFSTKDLFMIPIPQDKIKELIKDWKDSESLPGVCRVIILVRSGY